MNIETGYISSNFGRQELSGPVVELIECAIDNNNAPAVDNKKWYASLIANRARMDRLHKLFFKSWPPSTHSLVHVMTEDSARREHRKDRAAILQKSISDTIDFINRESPVSAALVVTPNSGFLVANCYFLISDAYKIRRGMSASKTHPYKVAAFVVAAVMAVRPIRITNPSNVTQLAHAFANQQCGMRAAESLLGFDLNSLDGDFLRRMYASVFELVELPCLSHYISSFDNHFGTSAGVAFEEIEAAIPYRNFNLQFSDYELKILEMLVNQFATLEKAHGNTFVRILRDWGVWK